MRCLLVAEVLAGGWEVLAVRLRCLQAEPQVAVEVLAGGCAASVVAEVLAGRAASGCLRYFLADVPQVADGVLAGRWAASG